MEKEPKFNKAQYSRVNENVRNIEHGKRTFKLGEIVKVERSNKEMDDGWEIVGFNTIYGGESAVVHKEDPEGYSEKIIGIDRLRMWNK
ncbi:MAG: hypothetical protein V4486_03140 [Patescibacteria group bacterium]